MPQRRANAGQQFAGAEGLGQIVVGAAVEGGDFLLLLIAGRKDDDRRFQPFSQTLQHFLAVDVRQARDRE